MLQAKPGDRFAEPFGLRWIKRAHALVEVDVAIGASPGAARAHDQERGGAPGKTLADIGAACFLADRVQLQVEQQVGDRADPLPLRGLDAQPLGLEHG